MRRPFVVSLWDHASFRDHAALAEVDVALAEVGTTWLEGELGPFSFESAPFCHVDGAGSLNHGLLLLS